MLIKRPSPIVGCLLFSYGTMMFPANAQLTETAEAEQHVSQDEDTVEVIQVKGIRRTLQTSLNQKAESKHVVETLDLSDIDSIPDVTIADAITRLPGVNGARDRGNQSHAVVRGLGPRMVLGTVNGREVASSEPSRNIKWESYPSELISGVQLYKTQSADLIAGGVAGTINLDTVDPFRYSGNTFSVKAGAVYYDLSDELPGITPFGNRFSAAYIKQLNDKVAFAVGVSSQKQRNSEANLRGWGSDSTRLADLSGTGDTGYVPWGASAGTQMIDTDRAGILAAISYRPNENIEIAYDGVYSKFDISSEGADNFYRLGNVGFEGGFDDVDVINSTVVGLTTTPFVSGANIAHSLSAFEEKKHVDIHGLNFKWTNLDDLTVTGDISYSTAQRDNYWNAVYLRSDNNPFSLYLDKDNPSIAIPDGSVSANLGQAIAAGPNRFLTLEDEHEGSLLEDKLGAVRFDANWLVDKGHLASIDIGARYSEREKQVVWEYHAGSTPSGWFPENYFSTFTVDGINAPAFLYAASYEQTADFAFGQSDFSEFAAIQPERAWKVDERNTEVFVKLNFDGQLMGLYYNGNIGLRNVDIKTESYSIDKLAASSDNVIFEESIDNSFSKTLPSASLNLNLNEKNILRFGVSKAISRPPVDELRAGQYIDIRNGAPGASSGNPLLLPFIATQADISYEWYFQEESLFALALYYKDIENYVGYFSLEVPTVEITESGPVDTITTVTAPVNGRGGYVRGAELTLQMPLAFGFGLYSNYAYADSNVKEFSPSDNPYAMAGLVKNSGTVDLWYADHGFDGRLGFSFHSGYTMAFGWTPSQLEAIEPEISVNFSLGYAFTENVSMRVQGNNLTNEKSVITRNNDEHDLAKYADFGRSYLVDVTYKF